MPGEGPKSSYKLVKEFRKLSYEDRLRKLKLTSLVDRRLRDDLIETYKIVTGKENVRKEDFFVFSDTGYNLRGHCYKLATTRSRLEIRRNFFSQSVWWVLGISFLLISSKRLLLTPSRIVMT